MEPRPLTPEQIHEEFESDACVVRDGHFVYTGGKHGSVYIRKDRVLSNVRRARRLIAELGRRILAADLDHGVEAVIGPEKSGIVMAHRVADYLDEQHGMPGDPCRVQAYYAEKEKLDGLEVFRLR